MTPADATETARAYLATELARKGWPNLSAAERADVLRSVEQVRNACLREAERRGFPLVKFFGADEWVMGGADAWAQFTAAAKLSDVWDALCELDDPLSARVKTI